MLFLGNKLSTVIKKNFLHYCLIITFSIFLNACIATVIATATATGLVIYDKRSLNVMEKDARIFHTIQKQFVQLFKHSHITVTSFNQTVLLAGQTPYASNRIRAEKIANTTPNVKRVYNQITIQSPISLTKQAHDAWITSQIKTRLLTEKNLQSGSIKVLTENLTIYLLGIITQEQAALAVEIARRTHGVERVVKIFQYKNK